MATFPEIPDLPTPITPDSPPPSELPVEPDEGAGAIRVRSHGVMKTAAAMHFMANRQFMFAAAFRWPRTSASLRPS